jgi:hypothetical protein
MKVLYSLIILFYFTSDISFAKKGLREVTGTSCKAIRVNVALDMTTQIVLDEEPKVTLFADKKHFKITTNTISPRSIGIIPYIESSELDQFKDVQARTSPTNLARDLDGSFKTNLFVFFENNNQLMFDLRFVEKKKADYLLKVRQVFNKDCVL